MPPPYSTDLRWRIVWLSLAHRESPGEIARKLQVSSRTVLRYMKLFESTGDVLPRERRNGPYHLLGENEELILLRLILETPSLYLSEIQRKLYSRIGIEVSLPTICRTLKRMGCTRQRIQHVALQQSEVMRGKYMANLAIYDPTMFIWIDETGCDRRNCIRKYGYSLRGITPRDHRLLVRGTRYSAIPVMSMEGIHDVAIFEGTVNGDRFEQFISNTLLPLLNPFNGSNPFSIVIMDNCSIHHVDGVINLIEVIAQAKILFLPPYSPDLMPLEEVFSQVKATMKDSDDIFQVCSAPRVLLSMAFDLVTTEDGLGYIELHS